MGITRDQFRPDLSSDRTAWVRHRATTAPRLPKECKYFCAVLITLVSRRREDRTAKSYFVLVRDLMNSGSCGDWLVRDRQGYLEGGVAVSSGGGAGAVVGDCAVVGFDDCFADC
jgi:hypothetical protein